MHTNEFEIVNIVNKMKPKFSTGKDGISNDFLKKIVNAIKEPLAVVFNKSLENGSFPNGMKVAKVKPLFKTGDVTLKDNYRPISLLSVISKILEKIVYRKVASHMEKQLNTLC